MECTKCFAASPPAASIIAEKHNLPVQIDERLKEVYLGGWEGMLFSDIIAQPFSFDAVWVE